MYDTDFSGLAEAIASRKTMDFWKGLHYGFGFSDYKDYLGKDKIIYDCIP